MMPNLNRSRILIALLFSSLLLAAPVLAKIYTWIDADGKTIYSDQPHKDATEVKLPPPQLYTPTIITPSAPTLRKKAQVKSHYRQLRISQPQHEQALWANNGQINVTLALEPALDNAQGHRIRIQLDGKLVSSKTQNTQLSLAAVDRGSHTLSASVHDRSGTLLIRSPTITFHVHRPMITPAKPSL